MTAPKLMPPFHSTAASGTFPTEHTKETIATIGPISGPTIFRSERIGGEEEGLPELLRQPGGKRTSDQQAESDVDPGARPIHPPPKLDIQPPQQNTG